MEFKSEGKVNGLTRQRRFDGQGKSIDSRRVYFEACFVPIFATECAVMVMLRFSPGISIDGTLRYFMLIPKTFNRRNYLKQTWDSI